VGTGVLPMPGKFASFASSRDLRQDALQKIPANQHSTSNIQIFSSSSENDHGFIIDYRSMAGQTMVFDVLRKELS
jgi:hypothetical protein